MSSPASPGYQPPGQGSAGLTDVVSQLQNIARQQSNLYKQMTALITAVNDLVTAATSSTAVVAALNAMNTTLAGVFPHSTLSYTFATLPATPSVGSMATITDGAGGLVNGNPAAGGGTSFYLVWWDSVQWTVVGI